MRNLLKGTSFVVLAGLVTSCASTPAVVRAEEAKTATANPGAVTIVMFTDFQCPFCRRTHAMLAPLVDAHHDKVRMVFEHVPLPRHPDARTAARAAICVETLTKELSEDYAHALYGATDLSEAACEDLALERGVDKTKYEDCLASPAVERRIDHDLHTFDEVGGDGVPLMFIGHHRIDGMPPKADIEDALNAALQGR